MENDTKGDITTTGSKAVAPSQACLLRSKMRIAVKPHRRCGAIRFPCGVPVFLDVEGSTTVEEVKAKIQEKQELDCIPPNEQCLTSSGVRGNLEDGRTLDDYNIRNESTLILIRERSVVVPSITEERRHGNLRQDTHGQDHHHQGCRGQHHRRGGEGEDSGEGGHPSGPAAPHLCWKAARGRPHPRRLRHPEGDPPPPHPQTEGRRSAAILLCEPLQGLREARLQRRGPGLADACEGLNYEATCTNPKC